MAEETMLKESLDGEDVDGDAACHENTRKRVAELMRDPAMAEMVAEAFRLAESTADQTPSIRRRATVRPHPSTARIRAEFHRRLNERNANP